MKRITLLPAFLFFVQFLAAQINDANQSIYEALASANKEWLNQQPDEILLQQNTVFTTDATLIQFHLNRVEALLRAANTDELSAVQKANREICLNHLHEYWVTGRFPKNTHHSVRTPYFIDDCGTVCAVGYLLVKTGHEDFANKISKENNYAYVRQMDYPELLAWAKEYGFSTDELALIQMPYISFPAYPTYEWASVDGIQVNGNVTAIKVDVATNILYVAADFESFGKGIAAFDGANWNYLGDVTGTVDVIVIDNQDVIIGGSFSAVEGIAANNIARWSGNQWSALGNGLNGEVRTLAFLNGDVYAGGNFSFSGNQRAMAKWNKIAWAPIQNGPDGTVYVLKEYGNGTLYAGGGFNQVGSLSTKNFVKFDGNNFQNIGGYPAPVYAMEVLRDTLFLGGQFMLDTVNYERYGFAAYYNSNVISLTNTFITFPLDDSTFINSMNIAGGKLVITGKSIYDMYTNTYGYFSSQVLWDFGYVVAPMAVGTGRIRATASYNGANLIGGDFTQIIDASTQTGINVSKFAASGKIATSIAALGSNPNVLIIYEPSKVVIQVKNAFTDAQLLLNSMDGKEIMLTKMPDGRFEVANGNYAPGIYMYSFRSGGENVGAGSILLR